MLLRWFLARVGGGVIPRCVTNVWVGDFVRVIEQVRSGGLFQKEASVGAGEFLVCGTVCRRPASDIFHSVFPARDFTTSSIFEVRLLKCRQRSGRHASKNRDRRIGPHRMCRHQISRFSGRICRRSMSILRNVKLAALLDKLASLLLHPNLERVLFGNLLLGSKFPNVLSDLH